MVKPKVYLIAKTQLLRPNLDEYLTDIGDPDWKPNSKVSDGETLIEAAGRMCYRSWQPYDPVKPLCSNPNVEKVREGNAEYVANIVKSGHGSVLEHVNLTFLCRDVSRVFTHELVRHRAGCAFSQESLRYVRLEDIRYWLPESAEKGGLSALFSDTMKRLSDVQFQLGQWLTKQGHLSFAQKKALTSMFRRLAPIGLATNIIFTANLRSLRHMIVMRTAEAAEEEIRIVFRSIAETCRAEYPNAFSDMTENDKGEFVFKHLKI